MDVAVLYKQHRMTSSTLMSHRGRHKKHQPFRTSYPSSKALNRSSNYRHGPFQRKYRNLNISCGRSKEGSSYAKATGAGGIQRSIGRSLHHQSNAQPCPPKPRKTLAAIRTNITNGDSKNKSKITKNKKNSESTLRPESPSNSSSRSPSMSRLNGNKKTSSLHHKRRSSLKTFFSIGSDWSTSTTSYDESSSTFVPARCKSIAKCFDNPYDKDSIVKNGSESILDDVLMPAEVLELPSASKSQSSASSVSYASTFVIPSPQSSAFFSHQDSILAKTRKNHVRDDEHNKKSPRRELGDVTRRNDNRKDDIWVERYYMNRKYEPVTYYRSVTNPDHCVLHEPPTGVNASNIIQMEDLQSAMRVLVLGKHQHHQHQEDRVRATGGLGFQPLKTRSITPRLSEYIEKTRNEDCDLLTCRDHGLTTSPSNHPYPKTIEVSIASSGSSMGSESYSSKASLLNADYNKKVATTEAIRKLMLGPLDANIQDVVLSRDTNKHHSKRPKKDRSSPMASPGHRRVSKTFARAPAASPAMSNASPEARSRHRKRSRRHLRMGLWQRLFPKPPKCQRDRNSPPQRPKRRDVNERSKREAKQKTSRNNRYYSSLCNIGDETRKERLHKSCYEAQVQQRNCIGRELSREMKPDYAIAMQESVTVTGAHVRMKKGTSIVLANRKRKCSNGKPSKATSLPLNTKIGQGTVTNCCSSMSFGKANSKPDPPAVLTDTTATSQNSSFSLSSVSANSKRSRHCNDSSNGSVGSASNCSLSLLSQDSLIQEA